MHKTSPVATVIRLVFSLAAFSVAVVATQYAALAAAFYIGYKVFVRSKSWIR